MTGLVASVATVLVAASILSVAVATVRLITGPTQADRVVALDVLLAAAVILCIAAGLASGRTVFIDVGIGVALTGFVGTVGWARAVERGGAAAAPAPSARRSPRKEGA